MSSFDDAGAVCVVIRVSTHSICRGSYSNTRQWLFERISTLRDSQKLTFHAIAEHLSKFGVKSARGKVLCAEHVFSIYKKGNAYKARLAEDAAVKLVAMDFEVAKRLTAP